MVHSQIVSNLERAWEITGRTEDELTGVMVQISQVVAEQLAKKGSHYVGDSRSGGRQQRQEALPRRWSLLRSQGC